jgi:hypothetical protein
MSTLEKISSPLSGPMSEPPTGEDIEAMIARLDKKWRELKKLLRTEEDMILEAEPEQPVGPDEPGPAAAADPGETWWSSLFPANRAHIDMTAEESEAIVKRVEKLGEETEIREQLAKVQWQNRGLIVYAVICTIMFLYMMVSILFSQDILALKTGKEPAGGVERVAGANAPSPIAALADAPPVLPMAGGGLSSPLKEASPQEPSRTAGGQQLPTLNSTTTAAQVPPAEYVGSTTSNKYHFRSCKWAKYIGPRSLRVFHSVAEAQKAGYISCPTCQPPLTDATQASAR